MKTEKIHTDRFNMRVEPSFFEFIDDWRASQRPVVGRSEAIRVLVFKGLGLEKSRTRVRVKLDSNS